jgi:hypothetical protein
MRQRISRVIAAAAGLLAAAAATVAVTTPAARAATPDVGGFGFVNSPVPPAGCLVDPNRQAVSSFMGCVTVMHIPVGRYELRYPGIGVPGGVVHVMAVNDNSAWCQAEK